jgi:transmembrane sensor
MKAVSEEAARWFARIANAPPDHPDRGRFEAWLAASPVHAEEYTAFARVWEDFDSDERLGALAQTARKRKAALKPAEHAKREARRALLKRGVLGIVACGGAGTLAWRAWSLWNAQPLQQLTLATHTAEMATRHLPDGSLLRLNARSVAQVTYYRTRREVRLDQGEILFDVAHDAERPFVIDSGFARITVLGTRFVVSRFEDLVRVSVGRGRVHVASTADGSGRALILEAGEMAEVGVAQAPQRLRRSAADAFAWERGTLVFDAATLPEIAQSLSRYRSLPVRAQASTVRVTAVVQVRDIDVFLRNLPAIAAVRVEHDARETRIVAR